MSLNHFLPPPQDVVPNHCRAASAACATNGCEASSPHPCKPVQEEQTVWTTFISSSKGWVSTHSALEDVLSLPVIWCFSFGKLHYGHGMEILVSSLDGGWPMCLRGREPLVHLSAWKKHCCCTMTTTETIDLSIVMLSQNELKAHVVLRVLHFLNAFVAVVTVLQRSPRSFACSRLLVVTCGECLCHHVNILASPKPCLLLVISQLPLIWKVKNILSWNHKFLGWEEVCTWTYFAVWESIPCVPSAHMNGVLPLFPGLVEGTSSTVATIGSTVQELMKNSSCFPGETWLELAISVFCILLQEPPKILLGAPEALTYKRGGFLTLCPIQPEPSPWKGPKGHTLHCYTSTLF